VLGVRAPAVPGNDPFADDDDAGSREICDG